MRPVEKGVRTEKYIDYRTAKRPLAETIGWYCSYCEMQVSNMLEVEHVVPTSKGGDKCAWENFLLACRYCNGPANKGNKNTARSGYIWPDQDNSFRAFIYDRTFTIAPANDLNDSLRAEAENTINLLGLDRHDQSTMPASLSDTRWNARKKVWLSASESLEDYLECPIPQVKKRIVDAATHAGFFSIWMTIFKDIPEIKRALIDAFPGTAQNCFDQNGSPVARPGGKI